MSKSAQLVRLLASLLFVIVTLVALLFAASPKDSDAQTDLIPRGFLPYMSTPPEMRPRGYLPYASTLPAPPVPPIIEITYVYYNAPIIPAAYEFVRINNFGGTPQDMANWRLADADGNAYFFPAFTLQPGAQVEVYSRKGDDTDEKLYWDRTSPWPVWNLHDTAYLYDQNGNLIDSFSY